MNASATAARDAAGEWIGCGSGRVARPDPAPPANRPVGASWSEITSARYEGRGGGEDTSRGGGVETSLGGGGTGGTSLGAGRRGALGTGPARSSSASWVDRVGGGIEVRFGQVRSI